MFVSTSEEALRVVAEQSREADARFADRERGAPHGIAIMILPEGDRFGQPVRPGGSLFIAWI